MQKLKSTQRPALKKKQNNEGVRVVKEDKGKPKSVDPVKQEKKNGTFEQVKGIVIQLSVKWIFDNWSLIHDSASLFIDVVVEVLK